MFEIKGTSGLYITKELKIKGDSDTYYKILEDDGIEIDIYGHRSTLALNNLYHIAKSNMFIEAKEIYTNLESFKFISAPTKNKGIESSRIICVLETPVYIKRLDVVYSLISSNTRYAISRAGTIFDLLEKTIKRGETFLSNQYVLTKLSNYDGIDKHRLIHRLMALAWIPNDDPINKNVVNHIDGNKSNYSIENLEWCTSKENNLHAVKNGLRVDTISVKIRNVDTNEIKHFYSITAATEYMGRSRLNIIHTNPIGTGKILTGINGRYEIKYASDNRPWRDSTSGLDMASMNQKTRCYIYINNVKHVANNNEELRDIVYNKLDGKIEIMDSITFSRNIDKVKRNYLDLLVEKVDLEEKKPDSYLCFNSETNEYIKAKDRKEVMGITNGSKSTVQKSIITNGSYGINNIWYVKYDDGKPFAKPAIILNKPTPVKAVKDGIIKIFSSIREAAVFFNVDKRTISNNLSNKTFISGYALTEA